MGSWSPNISDHERNGRAGVTRFGSVVSDRDWGGVTRLGPWSPMVSDHERQGLRGAEAGWTQNQKEHAQMHFSKRAKCIRAACSFHNPQSN